MLVSSCVGSHARATAYHDLVTNEAWHTAEIASKAAQQSSLAKSRFLGKPSRTQIGGDGRGAQSYTWSALDDHTHYAVRTYGT